MRFSHYLYIPPGSASFPTAAATTIATTTPASTKATAAEATASIELARTCCATTCSRSLTACLTYYDLVASIQPGENFGELTIAQPGPHQGGNEFTILQLHNDTSAALRIADT
jgi:hypothetical protein